MLARGAGFLLLRWRKRNARRAARDKKRRHEGAVVGIVGRLTFWPRLFGRARRRPARPRRPAPASARPWRPAPASLSDGSAPAPAGSRRRCRIPAARGSFPAPPPAFFFFKQKTAY